MTIVYAIGTGSVWENNELRYSVRSVDKHFSEVNDVVIVGHLPGFLKGVTHIDFQDVTTRNKERNIFEKVRAAAKQIPGDFLFMNDDHFITQDSDPSKYPNYYSCSIHEYLLSHGVTTYSLSVRNALMQLQRREILDPLFFDVHTPIIYNSQKFKALKSFNFINKPAPVIKSLYGNMFNVRATHLIDMKLKRKLSGDELVKIANKRPVFSISDSALCQGLTDGLNQLYPFKSKFEK